MFQIRENFSDQPPPGAPGKHDFIDDVIKALEHDVAEYNT